MAFASGSSSGGGGGSGSGGGNHNYWVGGASSSGMTTHDQLQGAAPEVDDGANTISSDGDSGWGDGDGMSVSSIMTNLSLYRYENGRRYQSYREGAYTLPNDEEEAARLDLYHHIWLLILDGGLFMAPISNPKRVLDIGTGTGIWALDFAEMYPNAEVTGNDLSPVRPPWVPPTCSFHIDDAESDQWTYQKDYFDFIHLRNLSGSFRDWKHVFSQAFEHLQPNGFCEVQEFAYHILWGGQTPQPFSDFVNWCDMARSAAIIAERPFHHPAVLMQFMREVGFVDCEIRTHVWPFGTWCRDPKLKEVGKYAALGLKDTLRAYTVLFTKALGHEWSTVEEIVDRAAMDMGRRNSRYYSKVFTVWGRKPTVEEMKATPATETTPPLAALNLPILQRQNK